MLWLCFKLPSCLLGNTRDTSVMHEKLKFVGFIYMQPQSEIQICSNKHETGLVYLYNEPNIASFDSNVLVNM